MEKSLYLWAAIMQIIPLQNQYIESGTIIAIKVLYNEKTITFGLHGHFATR